MWDATSGGNQIQNITLQQSGGAPTNQIQSVAAGSTLNYTYDAAGNVTNDGLHSYQYDAENRVKSVDWASTGSYRYDYKNRRIKKTAGTVANHYIWDGSHVLAEHNVNTGAQIVDYVFVNDRFIGAGAGSSYGSSSVFSYYLSDQLSERMSLDNTGNLTGRQAHLPFGEDFGEAGTQEKHHYTTYERDTDSSLDYAMNRNFSPTVGRFLAADRHGSSTKNPQNLNRNSYAGNDPVNRMDPFGMDWVERCEYWIDREGNQVVNCQYYWSPYDGILGWGELQLTWPTVTFDPAAFQHAMFTRSIQQAVTRFFDNHPDCQGNIDLAAQENGESENASTLMNELDKFVDTTGSDDLGKTLGALGFPAVMGSDLSETLGYQFSDRGAAAITNFASGTMYFMPGFFARYANDPGYTDRTVLHEMLHSIFQEGHLEIARDLGLKDANGNNFTDGDAARQAINNWLDSGCPYNPGQ
jgi:RHS repeat-associated protein